MATRSGSVDPGLLLWLLEREALSDRELADALEHHSGLLGLAGTADMREVLARADAGTRALALDVYVHRLRAGIAAMAAALGGLDVLVFTGGVGEHAPQIRAPRARRPRLPRRRARRAARTTAASGDADVSAERAPVRDARDRRARGPRDRPPGPAAARILKGCGKPEPGDDLRTSRECSETFSSQ